MSNDRFCQITLFSSNGLERTMQFGCAAGQVMVNPVKVVVRSEEFSVLVTPADCGHDAEVGPVGPGCTQFPAGALASGVPMLCVSTPEEERESLLEMVLLTIVTFNESWSEIPPPSQPARLLTIMLLVMATEFQ